MKVTRNQILRAVDRLMEGYSVGLCSAFLSENIGEYEPSEFIEATGGKVGPEGFYWPFRFAHYPLIPDSGETEAQQALNQRLMFLAFMLTWHDEIVGEV